MDPVNALAVFALLGVLIAVLTVSNMAKAATIERLRERIQEYGKWCDSLNEENDKLKCGTRLTCEQCTTLRSELDELSYRMEEVALRMRR